ncbi:MAG: hypoxanthine phosphoribosyltransferase [Dehalococcoidales bacterium]|nr:hypoxanthine phosphoribosyltransferase [Dehalococcoidales bacterium]
MTNDTRPQILISKQKIAAGVKKLAAALYADYNGKNPLLVGILKGSFVFMADLTRRIDIPLEVDFIRLASYGSGTQSSGEITVVHELPSTVKDRHVIIVEDIVDTGLTTAFLYDYLQRKEPASLKICALVEKPSRRKVPLRIDYLGFTVPDKFIVGYGMDCNEKHRNLPHICFVEENKG